MPSAFQAGFSLIEVVLAVGVISFALVGIIGLFPVAMRSALESQRETQVVLIARSLFAELERNTDDASFVTVTETKPDGTRESLESGQRRQIKLSAPDTAKFFFNVDGGMVSSEAAATYEAVVKSEPVTAMPGISKVDVTVSVPVSAPLARRVTYFFTTLIPYSLP